MKKLFYILCILVVAMSCDKQSEIEADSSSSGGVGDVVQFSLSSLTKADVVDKVEWETGDMIAVFAVTDDQYSEPYYYTVDDNDDLVVFGEGEPILFDGETQLYHAFYAGDVVLTSYEEYDALKSVNFSDTDCLFSAASATFGTEVELVFDHMYAKVILDFILPAPTVNTTMFLYGAEMVYPGEDNLEIFSKLSILNTGADSHTVSYTYYMAPTSSLDNNMGVVFSVTTVVDGTTTYQTGYTTFGGYDLITEWKAGEYYTYEITVKFQEDLS